MNDKELVKYAKMQPLVKSAGDRYFVKADEIEEAWKLCKADFSQKNRDKLWSLCQEGIFLFSKWVSLEKELESHFVMPRTVNCYKYGVMLLEKEERWNEGITFCEAALKILKGNEWYIKKMEKFSKKRIG